MSKTYKSSNLLKTWWKIMPTQQVQIWLMKTEPDVFSIDDLSQKPNKTDHWDGIRNYQARNFMRDEMRKGDLVLLYHSNCKDKGIVGVGTIVKEAYPDHTAWDKRSQYFDPKSTQDNPRWVMVDVKFKKKFKRVLSLDEIKEHPILKKMQVAKRGQRLSIQKVTSDEYDLVCQLAH